MRITDVFSHEYARMARQGHAVLVVTAVSPQVLAGRR